MMQKKDGEVKCWGFITSDADAVRNSEAIKAMHGLVGVHIANYGTGLIFETENDAKVARNILEYEQCSVSKEVQEVFIPEKEYQRAIANKEKRNEE